MVKMLRKCLAHIKNSINVSYTITIIYHSMEMESIFCSFI